MTPRSSSSFPLTPFQFDFIALPIFIISPHFVFSSSVIFFLRFPFQPTPCSTALSLSLQKSMLILSIGGQRVAGAGTLAFQLPAACSYPNTHTHWSYNPLLYSRSRLSQCKDFKNKRTVWMLEEEKRGATEDGRLNQRHQDTKGETHKFLKCHQPRSCAAGLNWGTDVESVCVSIHAGHRGHPHIIYCRWMFVHLRVHSQSCTSCRISALYSQSRWL